MHAPLPPPKGRARPPVCGGRTGPSRVCSGQLEQRVPAHTPEPGVTALRSHAAESPAFPKGRRPLSGRRAWAAGTWRGRSSQLCYRHVEQPLAAVCPLIYEQR